MAKLEKHAPGETMPDGLFGPRQPGRFITYWSRGQLVAASWPRKRTNFTTAQLQQQAEFKELVNLIKQITPEMRVASENIAEGSKYIWRDVAALFMLGKMVQLSNYGEIVSQYNLDILGTETGMIIIRTDEQWIALPRGNNGEVLSLVDDLPAWTEAGQVPGVAQPVHPGLVSGRMYLPPSPASLTLLNASANVLRAYPMYIPQECEIDALICRVNAGSAGNSIAMGIYENAGGLPGDLIVDAGLVSATAIGDKQVSGLAVTRSPGFIWLATLTNASINLTGLPATAISSGYSLGVASLVNATAFATHVSVAQTFGTGALPDPFPAGLAWQINIVPAVAIMVS